MAAHRMTAVRIQFDFVLRIKIDIINKRRLLNVENELIGMKLFFPQNDYSKTFF